MFNTSLSVLIHADIRALDWANLCNSLLVVHTILLEKKKKIPLATHN